MKTIEHICTFPPGNLTDGLKEKEKCKVNFAVFFSSSFLSLETHVTVTQCSRLSTSAGLSGRTCCLTKHSRKRRRTCSHAWLTSSTPLPHRRRKWASSRPRSSSHAYGKRTVRAHTLVWCPTLSMMTRGSKCPWTFHVFCSSLFSILYSCSCQSHWVHLCTYMNHLMEICGFVLCVCCRIGFNVVWIFEVKGRCMLVVRSFRE